MKETAKALAFTLVLIMFVTNFFITRPIVPTLPHKSWDWLTPWPLQAVRIARADLSEADKLFFGYLAMAVTTVLAGNLMELNEAIVDALMRAWESGGSGSGGGGGGGGGFESEMTY